MTVAWVVGNLEEVCWKKMIHFGGREKWDAKSAAASPEAPPPKFFEAKVLV